MPIEPKRIEAAARALMSDWGSIDAPTEQELEYALDKAKAVLAAGYPELASDPPTAWVAPIDATAIMQEVADLYFDQLWAGKAERDGLIAARLWGLMADAARDAYTKEQT